MASNVKHAVEAVGDKVNETVAHTKGEANKEIAKDDDLSLGTRAKAAVDVVGDKAEETKHAAKGEVHKQQAIH